MLGFGQLQAGIRTRGASVVRSGLLTRTCMRGNIRTTTLPCSRLGTDAYCPTTPRQRRGGGKNEYIPFISWEKIIAGRGQVRLAPLPHNCPIKRVRRSRVLLAPPLWRPRSRRIGWRRPGREPLTPTRPRTVQTQFRPNKRGGEESSRMRHTIATWLTEISLNCNQRVTSGYTIPEFQQGEEVCRARPGRI